MLELVEKLKIHTESILLSDIPLLFGLVKQLGVVEVVDTHIKEHDNHTGLSTGWLVGIWIVHVLHTGSHAKSTVQDWANRHKDLLEQLTGVVLRKQDFEDNRLSRVLTRLCNPKSWLSIEQGLWSKVVHVYDLESIPTLAETSALPTQAIEDKICSTSIKAVHIDSTASSGYHTGKEGLMQYGKSKDHRPDLRQFKLVGASIDGFLLSTQILPGNEADNPTYLPMVDRVKKVVNKTGLLYSGDSKMADLSTRGSLVNSKDYYLTRLPCTVGNAAFIKECITDGQQKVLDLVFANGEVIGKGYEFSRDQSVPITLSTGKEKQLKWKERVVVVRSKNYAEGQEKYLHRHIEKAIAAIEKLTPEPGRGKRQIKSQTQLDQRVKGICEKYKVDPTLFLIDAEKQVSIEEKYATRGRAKKGEERAKKQIEKVRFELKSVQVDEQVLQQTIAGLGWIVYVTQVPKQLMNISQTVSTYRENNSLENQFMRLKNPPINIRPIWVRNDDQIEGLTKLLSIALRLAKYAETIMQQALQEQPEEKNRTLAGLYPELPTKTTDRPTLKRCCMLFSNAEVTRVNMFAGKKYIKSELHKMESLHWKILRLLNIPITVYTELRI